MKNTKLRTRLILGVVIIVFLLSVSLIFTLHRIFWEIYMDEYHDRATQLADRIEREILKPVLAGKRIDTNLHLSRLKEQDKGIEYIFVMDPAGRVIFFTFSNGLPAGLAGANRPESGKKYSLQHLETEKGVILDIAIPVSNGAFGTVHAGITEAPVRSLMQRASILAACIAGVVLLMGIGLAAFFAHMTTRPISELVEVADAISKGDMEKSVEVGGQDEIGQLASSFNRMTESLRSALSELRQIYNGSLSAMRVIDMEFNVVSQNRAMCDLSGISREEAENRKCYEVLPGAACHTDECPLKRILGEQRIDVEVEKKDQRRPESAMPAHGCAI